MMVTSPEILGASILIVDDQDSNVSLLEELLRQAGYTRIASTMKRSAIIFAAPAVRRNFQRTRTSICTS